MAADELLPEQSKAEIPSSLGGMLNVPGLSQYLAMRQYLGARDQREQQQALANQFVKERAALGPSASPEDLTTLAMRYTNPTTTLHYGQASLDRKEATAQRLQMFHEQLGARMQDFADRRADAKDKAAFDQFYKTEILRLGQQQKGIENQLRLMGVQVQQQRADQQAGQQSTRNVQQIGTALERANLPEADATLRAAEEAIKKRPDLPEYMSGPKSLLPDAVLPADITAGRQAFAKLFNVTLKNRSGAAVTPPEFERLKQEFGTGLWKKPEQFAEALSQARDILSSHYRGVAAGFGPETLDAYNQNLRESGGTPLLEQQGAAPAKTPAGLPKRISSDAEFNALPSGTVFIGPDGKRRRKP